MGADGKIASIEAHGDISCTAKAYEKATSWSFMPDFPSLAEQNELLNYQADAQNRASKEELDAQKKKPAKPAVKLLAFSSEGDDAIVDFDLSRGVIETSGHKTFYFDKSSRGSSDPRWQEFPVSIHYRCDRTSTCELMHSGAGALRVRMKR
jgi:hypothetical protein